MVGASTAPAKPPRAHVRARARTHEEGADQDRCPIGYPGRVHGSALALLILAYLAALATARVAPKDGAPAQSPAELAVAASLLLNAILGWNFDLCIFLSSAIVLVYIYTGGLTSAIYNEVLRRRPDLARVAQQPFHFDSRSQNAAEKVQVVPVNDMPVAAAAVFRATEDEKLEAVIAASGLREHIAKNEFKTILGGIRFQGSENVPSPRFCQ